jgi:phosphoribosylanthranilate isomerase
MALIVPVMVRGINNLSDARYCAGMGADCLTFRLDPTWPDHLTLEAVQELSGWVSGVQLIGEFDTLSVPEINAIVRACGLHAVLLHRRRPAPELEELEVPAYKLTGWIPDMLPEDVELRFREQLPFYAGFVLATAPAQLPNAIELTRLTEQARTYSLWLGAGYAPTDIRRFVETVRPAGIVLEGGHEIKPGLRDFEEMEAVFEALEEE